MNKYLIMLIATLLFFVSPLSAFANGGNEVSETIDYQRLSEISGLSVEEVKQEYENYLEIKDFIKVDGDGNVSFDEKGALTNNIDNELIERTKKDVEQINNLANESKEELVTTSSCAGEQKWVDGVNGGTGYIDSCHTDNIVLALAAGATLSTIIGLVAGALGSAPGAAVNTIAGELYAYGATAVAAIDDGCGIKVRWYAYFIPTDISAQEC